MRPMIVPRFQLGHIVSRELKEAYYARIHTEHDTIVRAIERKIGTEARKAMREHLANSLERVRALGLASGIDKSDAVQKLAFESVFGRLTQSLGKR